MGVQKRCNPVQCRSAVNEQSVYGNSVDKSDGAGQLVTVLTSGCHGNSSWAVLWVIATLFHDRSAVTHECAPPPATDVQVSSSLSHVMADRRLLIAASGRFYRPSPRRSTSASFVADQLWLLMHTTTTTTDFNR